MGSEPRFGDQLADFGLEEGYSRWLTVLSSLEGAPMAPVQVEMHNGEPADAVLQRTLEEFNGKMVLSDCEGTILTTNGRFLAPKVVCFRPFITPKTPCLGLSRHLPRPYPARFSAGEGLSLMRMELEGGLPAKRWVTGGEQAKGDCAHHAPAPRRHPTV